MEVRCDKCQARYRIDDARVGPQGLTMRCGKCSNTFKVARDGAQPQAQPAAPAAKVAAPAEPLQPVAKPAAPAPAVPPSPAAPAAAKPAAPPAAAKPTEDAGATMLFGASPALAQKPAQPAAPKPPGKDEAVGTTMLYGQSPSAGTSSKPGTAAPPPPAAPPAEPGAPEERAEPAQARPGEQLQGDSVEEGAITGESEAPDVSAHGRAGPPRAVVIGVAAALGALVLSAGGVVAYKKLIHPPPPHGAVEALGQALAAADKDTLASLTEAETQANVAIQAAPKSRFPQAYAELAEVQVDWADAHNDQDYFMGDKARREPDEM